MSAHLELVVLGITSLLGVAGCGCSLGADPAAASNSAGYVAADGSVHFTPIEPGTTESFPIPVKESADTSETIQGAMLTGSAAASFKILSQFPIAVPNGQDVVVEVQFAPDRSGAFAAELMLQTAKMGTSQISVVGTGL